MHPATLEERLARLEDDRAIRDLKARYLRACDAKDADTVRDVLLPDGAVIAFDGFPPFDGRDAFVEVYRAMGCAPGVFDIHHGANGVITFETADLARGVWSLLFHSINLANRTLTLMGVEYEDLYVKQDGRWWIAETRSRRHSCLIHSVDERGTASVTIMGEPPATFG
jgi:hypothetical protein